jgi:hypothetical protein
MPRSLGAGVESDGGAILLQGSVGVISDSEVSDNVAAFGGVTSRAGGFSLWMSSSLTLVRCVVRQNLAHLGGDVSEGGGICVLQSSLVVVDSVLSGNVALRGGTVSRGGLIVMIAPSTAEVVGSTMEDNHAELGGRYSFGGAVYAGAGANHLQLASSSVLRNVASCVGMAAGGAVYLAMHVTIQIQDSELIRNQADAGRAEGGAIWSAAESLQATSVTFGGNSAVAHGTDEWALGGAIFQQGPNATLKACSVTDNLARISGSALRASGGALHCATGAVARLIDCMFQGNAAAGKGKFQSQPQWYASAWAEELESSGMHISSSGTVVMAGCRVIERVMNVMEYAMWFWIVSEGGKLILRDSLFETSVVGYYYDACPFVRDGSCNVNNADAPCPASSDWEDCGIIPPPDAGPFGKLVNVRSREVGFVIRGCMITNLTVKSMGLVGAVNSTFHPPLNHSLNTSQAVQPHPSCGQIIAGEALCDPRASCIPAQSGGVECSCVGDGLQAVPGISDGRKCLQPTEIDMLLNSRTIVIKLHKPGNLSGTSIRVQIKGERSASPQYQAMMARSNALGQLVSGIRNWSRLDQQQLSLDGHHLIWAVPSSMDDNEMLLDAEGQKFSATKELSFQLRVDECDRTQACVEDGDTVETVITVGSADLAPNGSKLQSEVRIETHVLSLLSCEHTRVSIVPDSESVPIFTPIRIRVFANDVDRLPVNFSRAEINLMFDKRAVPMQWSRGSNEYVADVPVELVGKHGLYVLVVSATNAWNRTAGQATSCELLQRTIAVREGLSTNWILAGSGSAAVVVVSGTVILVRRRHADLQAIMVMIFTEVSPSRSPSCLLSCPGLFAFGALGHTPLGGLLVV